MQLVHVLYCLRRLRRSARFAVLLAGVLLGAQALAAWHDADVVAHADVERGGVCVSCLAHGAGHAGLAVAPWLAPPHLAAALPVAPPGHVPACPCVPLRAARGPPQLLAA